MQVKYYVFQMIFTGKYFISGTEHLLFPFLGVEISLSSVFF